ncbi:MAG: Hsp20/alpha crystallin family protein [Phycisphaeraceae bacterium]|nr:Hsp20/alpha crystallin family protein [Phycisphaeraceae bacterium]
MNLTLRRSKHREPASIAPGASLGRLRDEMDRLFERFVGDSGDWWGRTPEGVVPALDVSETDTEVTVRAEVAGIDPKDLDISIAGNVLTVAGEKREETERKDEDYYHCERRFGSFKRMVHLPESVDPDRVTAEQENGVVTIRIAKEAGAMPKRVEVKPGKGARTAVGAL